MLAVAKPCLAPLFTGICAIGVAAPLTLWGFGSGAEALRWSALYVVGSACLIALALKASADRFDALCAAAVAWMAASILWSKDPLMGLQAIFSALALLGVTMAFRRFDVLRRSLPYATAAALFLTVFWYIYLPAGYEGSFGYKNAAGIMMVAALPWTLVLLDRQHLVIKIIGLSAAIIAAGWLVIGHPGKAHWAGVLLLFCVWLFRIGWRWSAVAVPVLLFDLALLIGGRPLESLRERLELWINTLAMWLDAPIVGHGVGSLNYLYPLYQTRHVNLLDERLLVSPEVIVGASHNDWFQGLAEIGIVGVGLFGYLLWRAYQRWAKRRHDQIDYAAAACLCILLGCSLVEFPTLLPATAFLGAASLGALAR